MAGAACRQERSSRTCSPPTILVAVKFLSIDVSAPAARALLLQRRDEFTQLPAEVGQDRDLADEPVP